MRLLVSLLCTGRYLASPYGRYFLRAHELWFRELEQSITPGSRVLFLDVGANTGWYGQYHVARLRKGTLAAKVMLYMFEPQPTFRTKLLADARRMGGARLVAAAAWIADANLTLHMPTVGAVDASLSHSSSSPTKTDVIVPAVDFGRFLRVEAPKYDVVVLKVDVDGAEYQLLPRLLLSCSLCPVRYLHLEWHLDFEHDAPDESLNTMAPQSARLTALAMRHAFDELLSRGCAEGLAGGRRSILHDESYNNGFRGHVHVAGLSALSKRHTNVTFSLRGVKA
jgi:FkbM family methyltransferase